MFHFAWSKLIVDLLTHNLLFLLGYAHIIMYGLSSDFLKNVFY